MQKIVQIKKTPNKDLFKDLLELFVYYNLSYPTGQKYECTIQLSDRTSEVITPTTTYKLSDELYVKLYILSSKVIATMYKLAEDDIQIQ